MLARTKWVYRQETKTLPPLLPKRRAKPKMLQLSSDLKPVVAHQKFNGKKVHKKIKPSSVKHFTKKDTTKH